MATKNEIDERLKLFQHFIDEYKINFITVDNFHDIEIESAALLNDIYWETVEKHVKKYMLKNDSRINLYKVISCTEYAIMKVIPFKIPMCESGERKNALINLNAEFAIFCSIALLKDWPHDDWSEFEYSKFLNVFDNSLNKISKLIKQDHLTWLNMLNINIPYPVFICSQFWKMISLYIEQEADIKHRF